jgi:DNA-binding transcriptional MerR regulator
MKKTYSTIRVAKLLDVTSDTLHRWIREGCIEAPPVQSLGGMKVRLWSEEDVGKARKYKAEQYRKKPNRKRKSTTKNVK